LQPRACPRDQFANKRKVLECDWGRGELRLAQHLDTERSLTLLLRALVTAVHYRAGLNDSCNEEAYTHSLACGLVEIAHNSPGFWQALHALLERHWALCAGWSSAVANPNAASHLSRPEQVVFEGRTCELRWKPRWAHTQFYGYLLCKQNVIELDGALRGPHAALIVLHEVLHFLHECLRIPARGLPYDKFVNKQAQLLPIFWRQNPRFWSWWLRTVCAQEALDEGVASNSGKARAATSALGSVLHKALVRAPNARGAGQSERRKKSGE
jgi:hypothetical protein